MVCRASWVRWGSRPCSASRNDASLSWNRSTHIGMTDPDSILTNTFDSGCSAVGSVERAGYGEEEALLLVPPPLPPMGAPIRSSTCCATSVLSSDQRQSGSRGLGGRIWRSGENLVGSMRSMSDEYDPPPHTHSQHNCSSGEKIWRLRVHQMHSIYMHKLLKAGLAVGGVILEWAHKYNITFNYIFINRRFILTRRPPTTRAHAHAHAHAHTS